MSNIIITGVLGQDGSNLSEYLLNTYNDHIIYGIYKRGSNPNTSNIETIKDNPRFKLVSGDITDQTSMDNIVSRIKPDYFINFAANSFVGTSWDTPDQVFNVNTIGVLKCLEALRKYAPKCRFYSAGSSEEFGKILYTPQNEDHPLIPVSPYAVAKTAARHLVGVYRDSYNMFAVHGTLYNHEGPRRGTEFVTRKVTQGIAKIILDAESSQPIEPIELGYIYAQKDWSDSRDMVRGVWMMLNHDTPIDAIFCSEKKRSIKEFVDIAFQEAGLPGKWVSFDDPLKEYYEATINGHSIKVVTINPKLYRPVEVGHQIGDCTKAKKLFGWERKITFNQMIREMIENDKCIIRKSRSK